MIKDSAYHSLLRIGLVVVALALIFDSGLLIKQTSLVSNEAGRHLASVVGVNVGVAPTDINVLTTRITELEQELVARERVIAVAVDRQETASTPLDVSTLILSVILFILLILIVFNYYLDYRRGQYAAVFAVDDKSVSV